MRDYFVLRLGPVRAADEADRNDQVARILRNTADQIERSEGDNPEILLYDDDDELAGEAEFKEALK